MRAKHILLGLGGAMGATLFALALLLFTPPGVTLLGRMAQGLTGGTVRFEGLAGSSINDLRVARLEIADKNGVWLRVEDAALRWSALALLRDRVAVDAVRAARVIVLRRPLPSDEPDSGPGPRIDVARADLPVIRLEQPVIGQAVTLTASGSLRYLSIRDFAGDFRITRADSSDHYFVAGGVSDDAAQGAATIREGADGILGRLAGLPGLGPVNLDLRADGPRGANRLSLRLSAGALRAQGGGLLRLPQEEADLDLQLASDAMAPREDISWESLSGEAHLRGRFDAPTLSARLQLANARGAGAAAKNILLSLDGDRGRARLAGSIEGLTLPGAHPAIFAASPLRVTGDVDLSAQTRPVRFTLDHRLARLNGVAQTQGGLSLEADLDVPSLAPFAALESVAMDGRAGLHLTLRQAGARFSIAANGRLDTRGAALPARLLGRDATLALTALMDGADILGSQVKLSGAGIGADINGTLRKGVLDYRFALQLRDMARLAPPLAGNVALNGSVNGAMGAAKLAARGNASLATAGFARQALAIQLQADGLPAVKTANLSVQGHFNDAPLQARATLGGGNPRRANVTAHWKSLAADADIALGDALSGRAHLAVTQLADLAVFTGDGLQGSAEATAQLTARGKATDATLQMTLAGLRRGDMAADRVSVQGRVANLLAAPDCDLTLAGQGLKTAMLTGDADAAVKGAMDALSITAQARVADANGNKGMAQIAALADIKAQEVRLARLEGGWQGLIVALTAPATIRYGETLATDALSLRLGKGLVTVSGQALPSLALRASLRDLALEDFRAFLPAIGLQGTVTADANLTGTLAAPEGAVTMQGDGLRTVYASRAMPAGTLRASARLSGGRATLEASLQAGERVRLTFNGDAPLAMTAPMNLRVNGQADLALMDIVLAASGRRLRGALTLDAAIAGTPASPRITGTGALKEGEFQDFAQGIRIQDIAATFQAEGETVRVTQMTARAGNGTISAAGTLDLSRPGLPVQMSLRADRARPMASDLITATISGNMELSGTLVQQMKLSGALQVPDGEINLPERFPPQVAVLNVRRRGQAPPSPPPRASRVDLDVTVQTTGPIFVRGRGIEAEMTGDIRLTGTTTLPQVGGGFRLVRGNYNLGGQRLDFTSGTVRFDGTGLRQRLDPTLDFLAQAESAGITARLAVTGYASSPRITLSSTPALPQDEVVAQLLFRQSTKQLSPLQLASIAQAAASLGGIGNGFNPLGAVRRTLGLDRLSVGSVNDGTGQSQTTVEAGSYVMRNVYVGVRQSLSGGTQTQVQVDVTNRLKAQATVNVGGVTTTQGNAQQQDTGSSIGLSYQLEY